jgi:hypothetical protein
MTETCSAGNKCKRNGSVVYRVNLIENICFMKMVLGPKHLAQENKCRKNGSVVYRVNPVGNM